MSFFSVLAMKSLWCVARSLAICLLCSPYSLWTVLISNRFSSSLSLSSLSALATSARFFLMNSRTSARLGSVSPATPETSGSPKMSYRSPLTDEDAPALDSLAWPPCSATCPSPVCSASLGSLRFMAFCHGLG